MLNTVGFESCAEYLWVHRPAENRWPNCLACSVTILAAKSARHKSERFCLRDRGVVGLLVQCVDGQECGRRQSGICLGRAERPPARWRTLPELIYWSLETDIEVDFAGSLQRDHRARSP